ncbi:hypothetical protein CGLO_16089 [Colletotrichum gloeosporioides Cg-14]|uniref:Uncharacterized protein n=1 Tax=Colletotrichum gloeosporioides (strain Cg-14) TaxID=1237896 RepID=T0LA59_COLGC|nr:hypothetical protein CGLO_16089 [Colletotrichum gloeosporioides Cg-14]
MAANAKRTSNVKLCSLSTVFRTYHHHDQQRRSA